MRFNERSRRAGDGLYSAVGTQHIHAGHDVDFARDKPCGDHRAFAVSDRRAIVDGRDHGQAGDFELGQIQRQQSASADAVGEEPGSWPDQFGIDNAAVVALDGDRKLGPSVLVRLGLRVDFPAIGVLRWNPRSDRQRFNRDKLFCAGRYGRIAIWSELRQILRRCVEPTRGGPVGIDGRCEVRQARTVTGVPPTKQPPWISFVAMFAQRPASSY